MGFLKAPTGGTVCGSNSRNPRDGNIKWSAHGADKVSSDTRRKEGDGCSSERKVLMLRAGIQQSEVARRLGLRSQIVCLFVNGKGRSRRVESAIAEALGLSGDPLWAELKVQQAEKSDHKPGVMSSGSGH